MFGKLRVVVVGIAGLAFVATGAGSLRAASTQGQSDRAEYVILVVLEGVDQASLKGGAMPVISRFVKEGSVTWSATAVTPPLRLPTMASLLTGMPVEKHGVTWDSLTLSEATPALRPSSIISI